MNLKLRKKKNTIMREGRLAIDVPLPFLRELFL